MAVVRDPAITAGIGLWGAIQSVSPSFGVELRPVDVRDAGEIERAIAAFAHNPNGGLIVTGSALAVVHRDLIIALAARYRLPAVYYDRYFAAVGGLISYGSNNLEEYRLAAGYVDRVLKGEKPTDLPVQAATKYELVVNLKTAKALGITIPTTVLARADEVMSELARRGIVVKLSAGWLQTLDPFPSDRERHAKDGAVRFVRLSP